MITTTQRTERNQKQNKAVSLMIQNSTLCTTGINQTKVLLNFVIVRSIILKSRTNAPRSTAGGPEFGMYH